MKISTPLGYLEFNFLVKKIHLLLLLILEESAEEATVLNVPCFTLRDNAERPETIEMGSNTLLGTDTKNIRPNLNNLFEGRSKKSNIPPKWDGKTSERIINIISNLK